MVARAATEIKAYLFRIVGVFWDVVRLVPSYVPGRKPLEGPPNCREETQAYKQAKDEIDQIQKRHNAIIEEIKKLRAKNTKRYENMRNTYGASFLIQILTVPIRALDNLNEFLRRVFGMKIQGMLETHLDEQGKSLKKVYERIDHFEKQLAIVRAEMQNARRKQDEVKRKLDLCILGNK